MKKQPFDIAIKLQNYLKRLFKHPVAARIKLVGSGDCDNIGFVIDGKIFLKSKKRK